MIIKRLKPDFFFSDDRGTLTQIVSGGYNQVNAVTSKKGAVRGGHYHKENTETFYVISGEVSVTASLGGECESDVFTDGDMFSIPPFTVHSMSFLKDTVLVVMYDGCVEKSDGTKDIIPCEA